VVLIADDHENDPGYHGYRGDQATGDYQVPSPSGLLCAAFHLPFEFAFGCRTSLLVGRHGRYPPWLSGESGRVASPG
jgi:hypothetical protein